MSVCDQMLGAQLYHDKGLLVLKYCITMCAALTMRDACFCRLEGAMKTDMFLYKGGGGEQFLTSCSFYNRF